MTPPPASYGLASSRQHPFLVERQQSGVAATVLPLDMSGCMRVAADSVINVCNISVLDCGKIETVDGKHIQSGKQNDVLLLSLQNFAFHADGALWLKYE